ncbi:MAG TPA: hypothetical protein VFD57_02610 [Clostridia bacterium]|nr:hypothetical protein [Clostridia bacterium]
MSSAQQVKEFNADLGELALNVGGGKHWKKFAANKIEAIRKTTVDRKRLFFTRTIDRIEIDITGEELPFIIQKDVIKDDFDWILDVLKSFANKNKVKYLE